MRKIFVSSVILLAVFIVEKQNLFETDLLCDYNTIFCVEFSNNDKLPSRLRYDDGPKWMESR